ncbi:tyrosine-type recombinase/integrase [Virgibacillus halotolerans]|uniref:tyrosine-type recombinase/integrase n=1 Tax=Virgibacillus halotolerans TaxID=1071053 RepID=UPI00196129BC|nr:tyrosine-type recombinase/integrase [Virgibacillus halotolerans]
MNKFLIEIDRYMYDCTDRNLSTKTMRSYDQTLRLFQRYLTEKQSIDKPEQVKSEHIRAYFTYIRERGKYNALADDSMRDVNGLHNRGDVGRPVSETTLANYQRNIAAFFSYLYREKAIRKNPCEGIEKIKPQRKVKALLSENELALFFRSFDVSKFHEFRTWIIARMILDTGCRIGELVSIMPSDIDLRNGALLLRNTKSKHERFVYFSHKMGSNLRSWLEYRDRYTNSQYVFPSIKGNMLDIRTVGASFKRHSKLVGLDVQPHQLRNNFAKYYLLNGGDWSTLSRILGHSSVDVTQQAYLDFTDQEVGRKYQKHSPLNNLDI